MRLINFDIPEDDIVWWRDRPHDLKEYVSGFHEIYNNVEDWHVFGWEWNSTQMTWWIDDVVVNTYTIGVEAWEGIWPVEPMDFIFNNAVMTDNRYGGATYPNYLIIDYMDLYEKDD